ncbi:EAL domain-containing protein [Aureimonas flava]|uniref:EAL domain-containing protein n=1 Tax=Aureimonas flava TaxID=2320271 RepID=A0A3A1WGW4_9HYPH|nr:EAL domain-containing protein [Aureimonas flava]RIX97763.1 EAL domain-containing protein [Aureimonas flava]
MKHPVDTIDSAWGGRRYGGAGPAPGVSRIGTVEAALRRSEAFARTLLDTSPDFLAVLDLDGRVLALGRAARDLLGPDVAARVIGRSWAEGWPANFRDTVRASVLSAAGGTSFRFSGPCPGRAGTRAWWDVSVEPVREGDGAVTHLLAIGRDVIDQKRLRETAEEAHARLSMVLDSTSDYVIVLDRDWRITYLNERARNLIGKTHRVRVGDSLWDLYPDHVGGPFDRHYREAIATGRTARFEAFLPRYSIWMEVSAHPWRGGLSVFFRDVTEAREARERLFQLANFDSLTGLTNRTHFNRALDEALASARQGATADGPAGDVTVMLLDLDLFKEVNDTLGHPTGDALLRQVAERLIEAVPANGVLSRLGGDEFAVLLAPGSETSPPASRVVKAIQRSFDAPFQLEENSVRLKASIGLAVSTGGAEARQEVFKAADIALYQAKESGRGTTRIFDAAMSQKVCARQDLKRDLAFALEKGELRLVYQPIRDLGSGRIATAEALLRWRHPEKGEVSPVDFIPLAEETGLINAIGEWVLEAACRQAAHWPADVSVAINISPVQFRSDTFPMKVAAALARSRLAPARLELEITESVLLADSEHNMRILHDLKAIGVRISLDDFGTGYSSLSYLRLFPFSKLKLDRCFVSDIGRSAQSEAIVRAVADMGHALSMMTTAEGVETSGQLDWLRANGWSQAQGYLIGRPAEADVFGALVAPSGLRDLEGAVPSRDRTG